MMFYSFVVIPFMIAVLGVFMFSMVQLVVTEQVDVYDLLSDVRDGYATKRWQAAYQLAGVLGDSEAIPDSERFTAAMLETFDHSAKDANPRVRQYLAVAMGKTGNHAFVEPLLDALDSDPAVNRAHIIHALGLLGDSRTAQAVGAHIDDPDATIRLQTVIALGHIGARESAPLLIAALNDHEPNVRWDAAVALAKHGNAAGQAVLLQLMDRAYLAQFDAVDEYEKTKILQTAIRASASLDDRELDSSIMRLAQSDPDAAVRDVARQESAEHVNEPTSPALEAAQPEQL